MVLVVLRIRDGAKILKEWYACGIPETTTLVDVYLEFSSGFLDNSFPLADEYRTTCDIGGGEHQQNIVVFFNEIHDDI